MQWITVHLPFEFESREDAETILMVRKYRIEREMRLQGKVLCGWGINVEEITENHSNDKS